MRPLNLRGSPDRLRGSLPNHSSSSARDEEIAWSVNSENFRLNGVFHTLCSGDCDREGSVGVGRGGNGGTFWASHAVRGGYSRATWSFS